MNALEISNCPFFQSFSRLDEIFDKPFFQADHYSAKEVDGRYLIELNVPNMELEDISVVVDQDLRLVKVFAKRVHEETIDKEEEPSSFHKEVNSQSFTHSIPKNALLETVSSELVEGKLIISFETRELEEKELERFIDVPIVSKV